MTLRLEIENETNLPDGGPINFTITGKRTVDIGRDQHLDWTLPDPSRFISGKHCEIRYKDDGYWLHDVSTNGTYLYGAQERMRGPHRLRNGDRFIIGQYIIVAALEDRADTMDALPSDRSGVPSSPRDLWESPDEVPPPIDPKLLKTPREAARPTKAEFLDWAADVPSVKAEVPSNAQTSSRAASFHESRPAENVWDAGPISPRDQSPSRTPPSLPQLSVSIPPPAPSPGPPTTDLGGEPASEGELANTAGRSIPAPQSSPFLRAKQLESNVEPPPPALQRGQTADFASAQDAGGFLQMVATAAGLPASTFLEVNQRDLARQLGIALRTAVEGTMQLLKARNQAKQLTRSASHTMIEATGNNPLKFSPTAEDAIRTMFLGQNRSYLDASAAFAQTFEDLKSHQLKTYAALQHAVTQLVNDLDPEIIVRDFEKRKAGSFLSSKKSLLWDDYRARWDTHMLPKSGGPISAFMLHFADYYDHSGGSGTKG